MSQIILVVRVYLSVLFGTDTSVSPPSEHLRQTLSGFHALQDGSEVSGFHPDDVASIERRGFVSAFVQDLRHALDQGAQPTGFR